MKRIVLSCITVSMFLGSVKYVPLGTANALFSVGPVVVCFLEASKYNVCFFIRNNLYRNN